MAQVVIATVGAGSLELATVRAATRTLFPASSANRPSLYQPVSEAVRRRTACANRARAGQWGPRAAMSSATRSSPGRAPKPVPS